MAPRLIHLPTGSAGPDSVKDSSLDPMKQIGQHERRKRDRFNGLQTVRQPCQCPIVHRIPATTHSKHSITQGPWEWTPSDHYHQYRAFCFLCCKFAQPDISRLLVRNLRSHARMLPTCPIFQPRISSSIAKRTSVFGVVGLLAETRQFSQPTYSHAPESQASTAHASCHSYESSRPHAEGEADKRE
jgi:hypothetical protein